MKENIVIRFLPGNLVALGLTIFHSLIYSSCFGGSFLSREEIDLLNISYLLIFVFLENWRKSFLNSWKPKFSFLFSLVAQGLSLIFYALARNFLSFLLADVFLAVGLIIFLNSWRRLTLNSLSIYSSKKEDEDEQLVSSLKFFIIWLSFWRGKKYLALFFSFLNLAYWLTRVVIFSFQEEKERQRLKLDFEFNQTIKKNFILLWPSDVFLMIVGLGIMIAFGFFAQSLLWQWFKATLKRNFSLGKSQIFSYLKESMRIMNKMTFGYHRIYLPVSA